MFGATKQFLDPHAKVSRPFKNFLKALFSFLVDELKSWDTLRILKALADFLEPFWGLLGSQETQWQIAS